MNRRMENLLGQPGGAREGAPEGTPEGTRDDHPDGSWRADALGKSQHARLTEHLREPLDDQDPEKAVRICGEVCRNLLQDLTPALILLPTAERRR